MEVEPVIDNDSVLLDANLTVANSFKLNGFNMEPSLEFGSFELSVSGSKKRYFNAFANASYEICSDEKVIILKFESLRTQLNKSEIGEI